MGESSLGKSALRKNKPTNARLYVTEPTKSQPREYHSNSLSTSPRPAKAAAKESGMSKVRIDFDLHELQCPHCEQQTKHPWPGRTILFSTAKCEHCSEEFLIVQNKPWQGYSRAAG
jgi:hypothetical protein